MEGNWAEGKGRGGVKDSVNRCKCCDLQSEITNFIMQEVCLLICSKVVLCTLTHAYIQTYVHIYIHICDNVMLSYRFYEKVRPLYRPSVSFVSHEISLEKPWRQPNLRSMIMRVCKKSRIC